MPNHITNTLEINLWHDEDKEAINKLAKMLVTEDSDSSMFIDFEAIVPPPENLFTDNLSMEDRQRCAEQGIPNWYDWNCENWGTKWNAYEQDLVEEEPDRLVIKFDTAWSPPLPVIEALRELVKREFPDDKGYESWVSGFWLEEGYQSSGVF